MLGCEGEGEGEVEGEGAGVGAGAGAGEGGGVHLAHGGQQLPVSPYISLYLPISPYIWRTEASSSTP